MRPSIYLGSRSQIIPQENQYNNESNIIKKNINKLSNRLFILSPPVKEGKDIECSKNDFTQEATEYISLGFIGKAVKASHKKTNRLYSIKAIRKDKIVKVGFTSTMNKYIDIMYKIDHCFFLRLLNHFEDETNLYLIFQCINETTLLDKINLRILDKDKIFKYSKQILEAVQFLHSKKIYFNSLEPESIIIDNNDNVRLTDYAYSKITGFESNQRNGFKTDTNTYINSYVAPELISCNKGKLHKHRSKGSDKSDLWELGILMYEMITGNLLFYKNGISADEFFRIISIPLSKNKDIIKSLSEIPEEFKSLTEIIKQLLDFNPNKRITIEKILKTKNFTDIIYEKKEIDPGERIINLKSANECWSPEEQLISKLKKENEGLKTEILSLKSQIKELTKKNEELNNNFNKIMNEEPDEESIKKETELLSKIRTLEFNNQIIESSLKEEKARNESLNEKIGELELDYNKSNKKIEELESKLKNNNDNNNMKNNNNKEFSKESLQYYLSLFNENIEQFTKLINSQKNKTDDNSNIYLKEINNLIGQKGQELNNKMNDFISKIKYDNEIKNKTENNIIWLKKQIDELFPYKKKCIMLNKEINKLQNQCDIIKNKSEYNNKIIQEKEKINILKFKKAKNKIRDSFGEFIKINLPNKLDEFNSLFKDLGFDNE
jgi:serine/threonine protein kinase